MFRVTFQTTMKSVDTKPYAIFYPQCSIPPEYHTDKAWSLPVRPNPGNVPRLLFIIWCQGGPPNRRSRARKPATRNPCPCDCRSKLLCPMPPGTSILTFISGLRLNVHIRCMLLVITSSLPSGSKQTSLAQGLPDTWTTFPKTFTRPNGILSFVHSLPFLNKSRKRRRWKMVCLRHQVNVYHSPPLTLHLLVSIEHSITSYTQFLDRSSSFLAPLTLNHLITDPSHNLHPSRSHTPS